MSESRGQITVSFDKQSIYDWGTRVPVEVFNEKLERVANETVSLAASRTLEIREPGLYLVRAELPSGESVATTVRVSAEAPSAEATLISSEKSPRENLIWAYTNRNLHQIGRQRASALEGSEFRVEGESRVTVTGIFRIRPKPTNWLMVPLKVPSSEDESVASDDSRLIKTVSFTDPWDRPAEDVFPLYVRWSVNATSDEADSSYVAVPTDCFNEDPPFEARLLFIREDAAADATRKVRVLVRSVSPGAEALLAYLQYGSLGAARRISEEVVTEAVNYLRDKRRRPFAACIAGYFLLRAAHEKKQDWMQNLANWFPMIPDGAVIYGTSLLRVEGGEKELKEARRYLLEAVNRGIPVYTVGLRLLFDGLRSLLKEGSADEELSSALARIRYIAAFTDWDAHTTTFSVPHNATDLPYHFPASKRSHERLFDRWFRKTSDSGA
jgi:hypothetical protein